jgi:hypothetical protein
MNAHHTSPRRHPVTHTAQLAFIVTVAAASVAWLLASVARLPEQAVVISVMVMAFVASWAITNHRPTADLRDAHHRVSMIQVRAHSS